jgi:hypothetical protein
VSAVLAAALLFAAGLPLAYVWCRNVLVAVIVAPLVTALSAAAAVMVMLVAGGPLLAWLGVSLLLQYSAVPLLWRRRTTPLPHGSWAEARWLLLPLAPPFLLTLAPPNWWDPHSIWWLHSAYFMRGADFARTAIGDPALAFSHTDYPPLTSATVAGIWTVLGQGRFYVAQFVCATVTFAAIAALVYAVRWLTGGAVTALSRGLAVGVGLAAWGVAPYAVASGYADPLWAAALVAGAVLLLAGREPWVRPALPLVLVTAAGLAKNEGLVTVVLLAVLVTVRERRNLRRAWLVWLPVGTGLVWAGIARHFGAESAYGSHPRFGRLLSGDPVVLSRIPPTLAALGRTVGTVVACGLVVAALGALFAQHRRRALGLGSDLWLWCLTLGYGVSLTATYVLNPFPIAWWLGTSIDRVTIPFTLLAGTSAACWVVCATTTVEHHASSPEPVAS